MEVTTLIVRPFFPVTLKIDGEDVELRVKRLTLEEYTDYMQGLRRTGTPPYMHFVSREPTGPDQEKDDKGNYVESLEDIALRKIPLLSDERRAEYEKAVVEHEKDHDAFVIRVLSDYLTIHSGLQEEREDGVVETLKTGRDFVRYFGARSDVLSAAIAAITQENMLSADQKKVLRSATASSASSTGPDQVPDGPKPVIAAPPAETEVSAETEDAMRKANGRSSSTGPSLSNPAPSSP